jgi:hypothetical protein
MLAPEQIERALRAQVMWGGRLGTNLVELGYIELDALTRMLALQHRMPAAFARHFDNADAQLQHRLEPAQVHRWLVVPLLQVAGGKIAVAAMDPIGAQDRAQIAAALAIAAEELVVSIAPEQRVRYQLERVYGIARSARFLRPRASITFPQLGEVRVPVESEPDLSVTIEPAPPPAPVPEPVPQPPADDLAALIDDAIANATTPAAEPAGRERRHYVRTLADDDAPAAIARIAIKQVSADDRGPGTTLREALRAIKRAKHRDRIAELAIDALSRFAPTCSAAMLMILRGDTAIGWKWFTRSGHVPPELAVPLQQAGLVPDVIASNQTARCGCDDLGAIDLLLLRALGQGEGDLVVVPVPIAGKVMCVLAIALEADAPATVVESVATAASGAFARLVRDASR